MVHYMMWRVDKGLNTTIELDFMIAGHTKFAPDHHFGSFKSLFRKTYVSSLPQIAEVVEKSAKGNTAYVVDHSFISYDWTRPTSTNRCMESWRYTRFLSPQRACLQGRISVMGPHPLN